MRKSDGSTTETRPFVRSVVATTLNTWNGKIVIDLTNTLQVGPEELGGLLSYEVVSHAFIRARLAEDLQSSACGPVT